MAGKNPRRPSSPRRASSSPPSRPTRSARAPTSTTPSTWRARRSRPSCAPRFSTCARSCTRTTASTSSPWPIAARAWTSGVRRPTRCPWRARSASGSGIRRTRSSTPSTSRPSRRRAAQARSVAAASRSATCPWPRSSTWQRTRSCPRARPRRSPWRARPWSRTRSRELDRARGAARALPASRRAPAGRGWVREAGRAPRGGAQGVRGDLSPGGISEAVAGLQDLLLRGGRRDEAADLGALTLSIPGLAHPMPVLARTASALVSLGRNARARA